VSAAADHHPEGVAITDGEHGDFLGWKSAQQGWNHGRQQAHQPDQGSGNKRRDQLRQGPGGESTAKGPANGRACP
jgi:hypothetical protein